MSFPSDRPEDCATRIGMGVASGAVTGAFLGAVASNWGDIPLVLRNKPLPALLRTGNVMVNYGATLAVVGLTYSAVDVRRGGVCHPMLWEACDRGGAWLFIPCCIVPSAKVTGAVRPIHPSPLQTQCVAESLRGKQDWVNGSLAGLATGGVLGIRSESADEMLLPCRYVVCPLWLGSVGRWVPVTRCLFLRHGTRLIDILLTPGKHTPVTQWAASQSALLRGLSWPSPPLWWM